MARVAAALALVLLVQGAFAAPSCGCNYPGYPIGLPTPIPAPPCGCNYPGYPIGLPTPIPAGLPYDGYDGLPAYDAYGLGAPALAYGAPDVYASGLYSDAAAYAPLSLAAPAATSVSPQVPVGSPQVVGTSTGPATAYTTGPVCQTSAYQTPVKSSTSAVSGPVAESTSIVDGYCSTACAATRARCGGTTKNVSFKKPTIINKGSRTSSTISAVGNAVTLRSVKPGAPQVETKVYGGPSYGPVPVGAPASILPAVYDAPAYAPGLYVDGLYDAPAYPALYDAPAYAPGVYPDAVYPAGVYSPPGYLPGVPAPFPVAPSTCACTCV